MFNPFSQEIQTQLIKEFISRPLENVPPNQTGAGAGVYGLFYSGNFEHYTQFKDHFKDVPIYVGKAVVPGGRKGSGNTTNIEQNYIVRRLREHAKTISSSDTLDISDFKCRWLLVVPAFVNAAEALMIDFYRPLWNCTISGFGIHTPGSGRKKQARSVWDMLHPGREFAKELPEGNDKKLIVQAINSYFETLDSKV